MRPEVPPAAARSSQFAEPALEEVALRLARGESERSLVLRPRLLGASRPAQQLGPGRVQVLITVELESIDDPQGRLRSLVMGYRHSQVELDDRGSHESCQLAVERRHPPPVDRPRGLQRSDRGLQDVGLASA